LAITSISNLIASTSRRSLEPSGLNRSDIGTRTPCLASTACAHEPEHCAAGLARCRTASRRPRGACVREYDATVGPPSLPLRQAIQSLENRFGPLETRKLLYELKEAYASGGREELIARFWAAWAETRADFPRIDITATDNVGLSDSVTAAIIVGSVNVTDASKRESQGISLRPRSAGDVYALAALLVAIVQLILSLQQPAERPAEMSPDQIQHIIEEVFDRLDDEPPSPTTSPSSPSRQQQSHRVTHQAE